MHLRLIAPLSFVIGLFPLLLQAGRRGEGSDVLRSDSLLSHPVACWMGLDGADWSAVWCSLVLDGAGWCWMVLGGAVVQDRLGWCEKVF